MPIPKPKDGESQDDFIERCMDNETMQEEYPDNKQRLAVCFTAWRERSSGQVHVPERACYPTVELRVDQGDNGDGPSILGYASVFNEVATIFDFHERVAPGAFTETIQQDDIRALWNHNSDDVLGRNTAGTLKLREDKHGLHVQINPPDTQAGRDAVVSIGRGDVDQMSIGFLAVTEEWTERENQPVLRTLHKVRLFDVSPTAFPAYEATYVGVRGILAAAGVCVAELGTAAMRARRGQLTDDDRLALRRNIEALDRLAGGRAVDAAQRPISPEPFRPSIETLRRRLVLLEHEV